MIYYFVLGFIIGNITLLFLLGVPVSDWSIRFAVVVLFMWLIIERLWLY